jgi:hypothetical protein
MENYSTGSPLWDEILEKQSTDEILGNLLFWTDAKKFDHPEIAQKIYDIAVKRIASVNSPEEKLAIARLARNACFLASRRARCKSPVSESEAVNSDLEKVCAEI